MTTKFTSRVCTNKEFLQDHDDRLYILIAMEAASTVHLIVDITNHRFIISSLVLQK